MPLLPKFLLQLLGASALGGCVCANSANSVVNSPAPATPAAEAPAAAQPVPAGTTITLERTACFGGCPVYALTIAADGTVTYEGKQNVQRVGRAMARISPEQVSGLVADFERAGYFALPNRYVYGAPSCPLYAADSPSAITSIKLGQRTKRIEHDYGCHGAPAKLRELERRIDHVVQSGQWTGHPR